MDGWVGKWVDEGMYVYVGRLVDEWLSGWLGWQLDGETARLTTIESHNMGDEKLICSLQAGHLGEPILGLQLEPKDLNSHAYHWHVQIWVQVKGRPMFQFKESAEKRNSFPLVFSSNWAFCGLDDAHLWCRKNNMLHSILPELILKLNHSPVDRDTGFWGYSRTKTVHLLRACQELVLKNLEKTRFGAT